MSRSRVLLIVILGVVSAVLTVHAEPVDLDPGSFKAAILSKIPPYIDFPKESLPPSGKEMTIGLLGEVSFQPLLTDLLKNSAVNGRKVLVRVVSASEDISKCQILFIPAAETERWNELKKSVKTHGILTVSDLEKFASDSGVIFNLLVEKRVLEINLKSAKEAGLSINSQLLRVAKIVR